MKETVLKFMILCSVCFSLGHCNLVSDLPLIGEKEKDDNSFLLAGLVGAAASVGGGGGNSGSEDVPCNIGSWSAHPAANLNPWQTVAYGAGQYVAIANGGANNKSMTSTNGTSWTANTVLDSVGTIRKNVYTDGKFFATVPGAQVGAVHYSTNGTAWTAAGNATVGAQWFTVAHGAGLYVAISEGGGNPADSVIMTSPDLTTWTARVSPNGGAYSVIYAGGQFVAVHNSGVMTSTDGITWTQRTAAEANNWNSVVYGGGMYVAVASTGTHRVMTSSDGITWTSRSASEQNSWQTVAYGGGNFVAVSSNGTNRIMTSKDGIAWTAASVPGTMDLQSVVYGDKKFVVVASSTSGPNLVATALCE
ncbi:hypothetical protein P3G55_01745 [Leptospira sp. 96542]|nr:hypothetical protein [Leptospira sp. 96542]